VYHGVYASLPYYRGFEGKEAKTLVNMRRKETKTRVNVKVNVSNVGIRRPWAQGWRKVDNEAQTARPASRC